MNIDSNTPAGNMVKPGDLLRMVAGSLISRGLIVQNPGKDRDHSVAIKCADGTQSQLTVQDDGSVRWDYRPAPGPDADPATLTEIAAWLLIGDSNARPGRERCTAPCLTLKGMVGRELRARGLAVCLEVYPDDDTFDVGAEIVAACHDVSPDAKVRITDDGSLTWERDYWPEFACISWEPEFSWDLSPRIGTLARSISDTIAPALLMARRLKRRPSDDPCKTGCTEAKT